ncbi:hypothetical protein B0I72DRAFT_158578 [Yarrowia lipolytica]|uniref:Uncharacterized protein n=1 Tax=Yarrowia lipolytica TaxID=4952 RepID=A0A371CDX4_YARLL|nr:hypothetical protein B0I71DRAFT_144545 [Yarrowia lipolytica]RDW32762.1 hypothetical protein B0I72DRAFT_158578 [Yarrowia lipolytica]RDW40284.1 hypothetical protein B0I73DRAFT_158628 [Yarrowia lipolytica]RDW44845.1 hypothetical protein B0I74DRAFT_159450 [Yarrowia lipolytica]RDW51673.1 hypothetical protein B0I75DRAFT_147016 [Yarrowia lipolytica]
MDVPDISYQDGILAALPIPKGAATGTGLRPLLKMVTELLGNIRIGQYLIDMVIGSQMAIFGGVPNPDQDRAPCILFIVLHCVFCVCNGLIFLYNLYHRHLFLLTGCNACYNLVCAIGFGLRLKWCDYTIQYLVAVFSVCLPIGTSFYLNFCNTVLGHRVFTKRHPETGNSSWFHVVMTVFYCLIIGVVVGAILGQALPYLYFMGPKHYQMCRNVAKAMGIICILWALGGLAMVLAAYIIPVGAVGHEFPGFKAKRAKNLRQTTSPFWVTSFGIFYYPEKPKYKTFTKRSLEEDERHGASNNNTLFARFVDSERRNPVRVISDLNNNPTVCALLICFTSCVLTTITVCRTVSLFTDEFFKVRQVGNSPVFQNYTLYATFGALECIVNALFLLFRIDLRFYIPDREDFWDWLDKYPLFRSGKLGHIYDKSKEIDAVGLAHNVHQPQDLSSSAEKTRQSIDSLSSHNSSGGRRSTS